MAALKITLLAALLFQASVHLTSAVDHPHHHPHHVHPEPHYPHPAPPRPLPVQEGPPQVLPVRYVPAPEPQAASGALNLPSDFYLGIATDAYEVEGAWCDDSNGENIWDRWTHSSPNSIADHCNGDISADEYYHLEEDVALLRNLSVKFYRFEVSWSRILPTGCSNNVNHAGIHYYLRLIKLLREHNIEPVVALYSTGLPQALQDQGGFLNENFPDWFADYAKVVFDSYSPYVRYWVTFNQPTLTCKDGYGTGLSAPGYKNNPGSNEYICAKNLLLAHARAYRSYDEYYRPTCQGHVAITLYSPWFEPASTCESDLQASDNALLFQLGLWADPIFFGDFPDAVKYNVQQLSEAQGLCESRLPTLSPEESALIKGTLDYISIHYGHTNVVTALEQCVTSLPSWDNDSGVATVSEYDVNNQSGLRKLLNWFNKRYSSPPIAVKSGYRSTDNTLNDEGRIQYLQNVLSQVRSAIYEDGVPVTSFVHYSFLDGFEGRDGFTLKYGLYAVDFLDPARTRRARKSVDYYRFVAQTLCLDYHHYPHYPHHLPVHQWK